MIIAALSMPWCTPNANLPFDPGMVQKLRDGDGSTEGRIRRCDGRIDEHEGYYDSCTEERQHSGRSALCWSRGVVR
jgi:hypothetical protein